uniref:Uncharacterized protein n=1 Tax=Panthera tigris altaica TaxID=74533 RepID=A0A8C9M893_PANTA
MPTTVAQRWTKPARVQRTWGGGGWVPAAQRQSPRAEPETSPEEPPPTPQDPAGK